MTIWLATGNINKKKELSGILLSAFPKKINPFTPSIEIKIPPDAGINFNPDENGNSFLENSLIKAKELYRLLAKEGKSGWLPGDPIISDDSGICVDSLDGRPGIYSARFGGDGLTASQKNALLLRELGDNKLRTARFVCAMVLYFSPDRFFIAQETIEGEIVENEEAARGKGGFGYDPVFYIPDLSCTAAELSDEDKNIYSHRGKAGRIIAKILFGNIPGQGIR
ncbi:MAG: non-canonical purine NTP pyrophosphatase [Treponema sp.]|nr:non-canonical purine NTP pyrophosphatase [Treponema sp.]